MIPHGFQPEIRHPLDILQESFLLFNLPFHPFLVGLHPGLHLLGLGSDIGTGGDISFRLLYGIKADLRIFILLRPPAAPVRSRTELPDLLPVLLIFRYGILVALFLILPPGGEIPHLNLYGLPVHHQHVVTYRIKKIAVVGYQDEALLRGKIPLHHLPGFCIQMVGGFVDQKKLIFPCEQHRQHDAGPLPVAEGSEGTVQKLRIHPDLIHLDQHLPGLRLRLPALHQFIGGLREVLRLYFIGEIVKMCACHDTPLIFIITHQQPQQGGLSLPVPSYKSQFPVGIDMEGHLFQNILRRALIGKCKICHLDLCHVSSLLSNEKDPLSAESGSKYSIKNPCIK